MNCVHGYDHACNELHESQTVLHVHKDLCTLLIPLCKKYLLVNLRVSFHSSYFADGKNIEKVCWVYV